MHNEIYYPEIADIAAIFLLYPVLPDITDLNILAIVLIY
jgi:hypothetical protein